MKFKSWKDQYLFIKEYATCSCINCYYGTDKKSDKQGYSRVFCKKFLAMVEFKFQFLCAEWVGKDGKPLKNYENEPFFRIDDDLLESLDNNHEWSFEELKEKINEEIKK